MKKIYLPILATLLIFSSCQCNKNQTSTPSGSPPTASAGVTSGQPTSVMIPPSLTGGTAGNFIIRMNPTGNPLVCNPVHIFVYFPTPFDVHHPQVITVTSAGLTTSPMIYTDNPTPTGGANFVQSGTFGAPPAFVINSTGAPMAITISATVNGVAYSSAPLQPLQPNSPNDASGLGVVTYSDGNHQAVIVAEDEGINAP